MAGFNITLGFNNAFFGITAGYANQIGGNNCLFGSQAGYQITGSGNICVGAGSGYGTIATTSGTNNIYVGIGSHGSAATNQNEIVIGASAVGLGSNTTVIGNSSTTLTKTFGVIVGTNYTVATLPSASTSGVGARAFVTDALAPVFGATVVTGGAVATPVYSTGSAWNVG